MRMEVGYQYARIHRSEWVQSGIVYISGSSFAEVLSLCNSGMIWVTLLKEDNYVGLGDKGSTAFLPTSTGALISQRYYCIDGTGGLFDEQYMYLFMNGTKGEDSVKTSPVFHRNSFRSGLNSFCSN